jgi:hypothetical protein
LAVNPDRHFGYERRGLLRQGYRFLGQKNNKEEQEKK